jgi:hypothetical protein
MERKLAHVSVLENGTRLRLRAIILHFIVIVVYRQGTESRRLHSEKPMAALSTVDSQNLTSVPSVAFTSQSLKQKDGDCVTAESSILQAPTFP